MVALKTERRVFLWRVGARSKPKDSGKNVTLEEIIDILENERLAGNARAYLAGSSRLLDDDDDQNRDEKNQIYIADIQRADDGKTITLLINRGDPNIVSPAFIKPQDGDVRIEHPKKDETPGASAHLVIGTDSSKGYHRACFEKMPNVSSYLALSLIDRIVERATASNPKYRYEVIVVKSKTQEKVKKRYQPMLETKRVPSEKLTDDLERGTLASITLTKEKAFYTGVGTKELVKRQQEKVVITTVPAEKPRVVALVKGIVAKAKKENYKEVSFHLQDLPGGQSNNPTIALDDHDALEQLYVRARRLTDFAVLLEGCYAEICPPIQEKMIAVVLDDQGW